MYLNSEVTAEIEIETIRTHDSCVNDRAGRDILGSSGGVALICAEETGVVTLLDDDVGDRRAIIGREHQTRRSDPLHLFSEHLK